MKSKRLRLLVYGHLVIFAGCSAVPSAEPAAIPQNPIPAGTETVVNVQTGKACCKYSVLDLLGITQIVGVVGKGVQSVGSHATAWLGSRFPGLEPKPPLLAFTDPKNSSEDASPAAKAAADAKAEEDAAAQEVKALRYLGQKGCGGCNLPIEKALLSALDDCREVVRYGAAAALRESLDHSCLYCNDRACCSVPIRTKLSEVAFKMSDDGTCFVEPSGRVRRLARIVLNCCGGPPPLGDQPTPATDAPLEGPPAEPPSEADAPTVATVAPKSKELTSKELTSTGSTTGNSTTGNSDTPRAEPPRIKLVSGEQSVLKHALADEQLLATVAEIPIYHRDLASAVAGRMQKEGGRLPRHQIVTEELQRAIDELVAYQHHPRKRFLIPPKSAEPNSPAQTEFFRKQGRFWLDQAVSTPNGPSVEAARQFYFANQQRYLLPARVWWEQVTVTRKTGLARAQAAELLEYLRNEALGRRSTPPTTLRPDVFEIKTHDLTIVASIRSPALAKQLAVQDVGQLGQIVEDEAGWHLLRVLSREPDRPQPFQNVAEEIRRELLTQQRLRQRSGYAAQLRRQTKVWVAWSVLQAEP